MAKKSKKADKTASAVDEPQAREEQAIPKSIPSGFRLDSSEEASVLDWDRIADDPDLELCVFRIPANVKLKHLEDVKVRMDTSKAGEVVGRFETGKHSCEVVSAGGVEDVTKVVPLLASRRDGRRLKLAPKQVARQFVVRQRLESGPDAALPASEERARIRAEDLHGFFRPYGYESAGPGRTKKRRGEEPSGEPRKKRR